MVKSNTAAITAVAAPGAPQGILLGVFSLVAAAASILLAPVLPAMVEHFSATDPNAQAKVMLAFSLPSLVVAICSNFVGVILDRFGRKPVLVASLTIYSLVGILPAFIGVSLNALILLRVLLGCLLYTSPSPRDRTRSRMPSSA